MTENSRFIRVPLLAALMGLLVSLTAPSHAATWYVRPDGDGSGTGWGDALGSFQAAIDTAAAGDEIWGASGVYNESLTLKAGIALYGGFAATETVREDRDFAANPTILDAAGLNRRVITADGTDGVTIDGFTIRNGTTNSYGGGIYIKDVSSATVSNCTITANTASGNGAAVYCSSSSPTLTHCVITGNTADRGGGVYCHFSSPILTHCTISGNRANRFGGGVYCSNSSPTLIHCTISGNTASYGGGVYCSDSSPTLTHCTISGNTATYGGGVACFSSSSPTLTNCILWNPGNEISVDSGAPLVRYSCAQGGYPGEGNIDAYPQFVDPVNGDWRLRDGSPCIDRGADFGLPFDGEGPDMGSWEAPENYSQGPPDHVPQLFRVDHAALARGDGLSWVTAFSTVGEALLHSSTADEIWVAAGTYNESIHLEKGSALYGSFAGTETVRENRDAASNPTILDAAGLNQRVITVDRSEGVIIDGFTIRNGNSSASGGGIYFNSVSSATVSHCTISGNTAKSGGGGLNCNGSSPTLTNCTISGNTATSGGGVVCSASSSPTLTHCMITGNTAAGSGGGVFCSSDSSPTLAHCTISDNSASSGVGGGVSCGRSSPTLTHTTISGNTAAGSGGGVYCDRSSPTLTNCTISGNTASSGGGVHCSSSSPMLAHCTISDNTARRGSGGGVVCSSDSSPTLAHCTISGNTTYGSGGGVYVSGSSSSPTLTHCTISANTAYGGGGGVYCSSSSPTVTHCMIAGNTARGSGGGVYLRFSSSPTLIHCTISGNSAGDSGGGVYISGLTSKPTLTNCILWNAGIEIFVVSGAPLVRYSCAQGGYPGEGNIDAYPQFVDPLNGDWRLLDGSPCIDRGTDVGLPFNGAGPDMGSWEAPENYSQGPPDHVPQLFRVNHAALSGGDGLSWETAFPSFREALFFSSNSDEIWVAAGTYNESITMKTGLALYGGFAGTETVREDRDFVSNPTILDAAGLNQRVITADGTDGVTIDGFTIRNGNSSEPGGGIYFDSVSSATVSNCTISSNTARNGGGVYCQSSSPILTHCTITGNRTDYTTDRVGGGLYSVGSSPMLIDCTITGNTAGGSGGGVYCDRSSPTLTNCTISGNTAYSSGGVHCSSSSPMLAHCTISDNTARHGSGGGVICQFSSPMLNNCTISGNTAKGSGGGVHCSSSSPTLTHCIISNNTVSDSLYHSGRGAGVYCSSSSPTLTHCTISGNTATGTYARGGAMVCDRSSPTLTNCTISGNTANGDGNGVASFSSSSPTLINCILWNGGDEVYPISPTAEVTFSAVQGGYPGQGNIDEDPMFVDPELSDYRLSMGSPCVDSGSNGAVLRLGPSVLALGDHDGRMRIWDGDADGSAVVDMGAYEFGPPPFVGDVFGDARVNHLDLFRFQQVWNQEGDGIIPEADQDGDRTIGPTDLTILRYVWGNINGP